MLLKALRLIAPALAGIAGLTLAAAGGQEAPDSQQTVARIIALNAQIAAAVRSGSASGPQVDAGLAARRALLEEVLRNRPQDAKSYALDESVRATLVAADARAAELLEAPAVRTGELVASVADDFAHGRSWTRYRLRTVDGDIDLAFPAQIAGLNSMLHRQVTVRGIGFPDIIAADSVRELSAPEQECGPVEPRAPHSLPELGEATTAVGASCSTKGSQHIAVLILEFPNNTPAYPAGLDQASYWQGVLFGPEPSVTTFWKEASYGQTGATGDVFGPIKLSQSFDCTTTSQMQTAAFAAAAGKVNFADYNRFVLVYPASTCTFGGLGDIGCGAALGSIDHQFSVVWLPIMSDYSTSFPEMWGGASHELGHNLGLNHANTLDFGSMALGPLDFTATNPGTVSSAPLPETTEAPIAAVNTEYGDPYSAMAVPWNHAGPYSGEHRSKVLGWIPASNVETATKAGTFTLQPVEESTGTRVLRVLRDPSSNSWLSIEFHQPIGYYAPANFDAAGDSNITSGIQVHYDTPSLDTLHTYLLDMAPTELPNDFAISNLARGEAWSDPYTPLSLKAVSQTDSSVTVAVAYDASCAKLSLSSSALPAAGGTATLSITAPSSCKWTVSANEIWITLSGTTSGSGNGTVHVKAARNTATTQRNTYISAARQSLPLVQEGTAISFLNIAPNNGSSNSGASAAITLTFDNDQALSDLRQVNLDLSGFGGQADCSAAIVPYQGEAYLYLYANGGFTSGIVAGNKGTITTPSCSLSGAGSSYAVSGTRTTVTLDFTFPAAFVGVHDMTVGGFASFLVPTVPLGLWTVNAVAAKPTFKPAAGTYSAAQTVTISDTTAGSVIYYTKNGAQPTTSSTKYTGAIKVSADETITAIAVAKGYGNSPAAAAKYIIK